MNTTIWKAPLPLQAGPLEVQVPYGASGLSVGIQDSKPVFWYQFPTEYATGERVTHKLYAIETGDSVETGKFYHFLGTLTFHDIFRDPYIKSPYVLHYFEVGE